MKLFKHQSIIFTLATLCLFASSISLNQVFAVDDNTDFNISVDPTLEITIPDSVNLLINPSVEGTIADTSFDITVGTNNLTGYTLTMYNDSSNLTSTDSSAIIPTLSSEIAKSNFPVNHWGYSLDDNTYKPITTATSGTVLKTTETTSAADTTTINLATKVDLDKPAGTYTNTFVFTILVNEPSTKTLNIIGLGDIQYESGMTWKQWINSEYNTLGLVEFETPNPYWGYCAQQSSSFPRLDSDTLEVCDSINISSVGTTNSTTSSGPVLWYMYTKSPATIGYMPIDSDKLIETYTNNYGYDSIPTIYVFDEYYIDSGFGVLDEGFTIFAEFSLATYGEKTWRQWANEDFWGDTDPFRGVYLHIAENGASIPYAVITAIEDKHGMPGVFLIKIGTEEPLPLVDVDPSLFDFSAYNIDPDWFDWDIDSTGFAQIYQIQDAMPDNIIIDGEYLITPLDPEITLYPY